MEESKEPAGPQTVSTYIKPQYRPVHDPTIRFEEYHHYAKITREKEEHLEAPKLAWKELFGRKNTHHETDTAVAHAASSPAEKGASELPNDARAEITDEEWENAGRALRTASAGACQYTI